jgi:hypothetical protein
MISEICRRTIAAGVAVAAVTLSVPDRVAKAQSAGQGTSPSAQSLDYEVFKTRIQPIFLERRSPNHARCYACHEKTKHPGGLSLESLSPGSSSWTEEQSSRNFQAVSKMVVPGDLTKSMFPHHPLAPEAGGDERIHSGGRQFESQDDPAFQAIAAWVLGKK